MAAELIELSGAVLLIIVSGTLSHEEFVTLQAPIRDASEKHEKVRILAIAEDFQGWDRSSGWGDMSYRERDAQIECMALVGDRKWKEPLLAFVGEGFRAFPIAYFEHGEVAKARAWIKHPH